MWLLEPETKQAFEKALKNITVTQEEKEKFEARLNSNGGGLNLDILIMADDNATISIDGILTEKPSFFAFLFGGGNTAYTEIVEALNVAEAESNVKQITLLINSPGGNFDGLFSVIETLQQVTKPITARIESLCASAAYAIAAQADEIIASNVASRVGSVGVVTSFFVYDNEVTIASTKAPKKAPDVTTDEGVAIVKEQLDAMHSVFVDAIVSGRNVSAEHINQNFGQGAVFLAEKAEKAGMIDFVDKASNNGSQDFQLKVEEKMDINTLKSQHLDVYNAVFNLGVAEELDRVSAHLTMGKSSGDMETAITAITDGSDMTKTLQAKYLAAAMNKSQVGDRQDDNPDFNANGDATLPATEEDMGDKVAAIFDLRRAA